MDVEAEIRELKRRVGDLEGAVNVLSGQIGKVHPDLVAFAAASETRFDRMEDLVGKVTSRLDLMNTQIWSLRDDLPIILARARSGDEKS
jgi:hypothetical protein